MATDYQMIKCTARIREAINHLLSEEYINETLREELERWARLDTKTAENTKRIYLHELLEGSELQLPAVQEVPRNPELVARLNAIRVRAEERAYKKMVNNVDPNITRERFYQLGLEVQSTSRQLWTVVNFFITVIGAFTFGYFAAHFAGLEVTLAVFMGLGFAIVVFFADLYFLVKTPSIVDKRQ